MMTEIDLDDINDDFIKEHLFDTLGRLNGEYKYLLCEQKIIEYLINRFNDCDNIEEAARRIYKNIETAPICPVCGNKCKYKGGSKIYEETCGSINCKNTHANYKHLETFKANHNGLTNLFQLPEVKEKIKKTMLEKYGVEYSGQIEEKKRKSKQTWLSKYGVDNPFKSKEIQEKSKKTCLEKYGVEYSFQSENNKEKSKKTCLEKYGVDNPLKSDIIKNKSKQTKLEKYGDENYSNHEKAKQTKLEKYGNENYVNIEKTKKTKLEKYGNATYVNPSKASITNLQKYGVKSPLNQQFE